MPDSSLAFVIKEDPLSAISAWKDRINAHNEQTARSRGDVVYEDMWSALAERFRDDPHRTDDLVVNALAGWLNPSSTVLDVGGGAGRYALPLALRAKQVTVVDPSPAMLDALKRSCEEAGIDNAAAVHAGWEDAEVEPADLVLCANVVYGVANIEPFVRKLAEMARERVAIVLFMDAPLSRMSPIWEAVHGEKRIEMPALPELLTVLWEMDIFPNVEMLPVSRGGTRHIPNMETAITMARHFLYIQPGSEKEARLRELAPQFVEETPEGLQMKGASERPLGIVWWRTRS
jgi:2-polyprenyl-3-methyl-5-hydroxy-6-metoxy-1,4-benzoquinol methylase